MAWCVCIARVVSHVLLDWWSGVHASWPGGRNLACKLALTKNKKHVQAGFQSNCSWGRVRLGRGLWCLWFCQGDTPYDARGLVGGTLARLLHGGVCAVWLHTAASLKSVLQGQRENWCLIAPDVCQKCPRYSQSVVANDVCVCDGKRSLSMLTQELYARLEMYSQTSFA